MLWLNGFMPRKIQENFFLPVEVADAVRPLIEEVGIKRKWQIYTAAIIAFLARDRDAQHTAMSAVNDADMRKEFNRLLIDSGAVKGVVVGNANGTPAPAKPENRPHAPRPRKGRG